MWQIKRLIVFLYGYEKSDSNRKLMDLIGFVFL